MNIKRTWSTWKIWVSAALFCVLAVDIALVVILWKGASEDPAQMQVQKERLKQEDKLLKGDVERGERIRGSLASEGKEADNFYQATFLDASSGYSSIAADLDAIAVKAGLQTRGVTFRQAEVKGRGVTEVSISEQVEGNYMAVLQFINGLERSKNFYLLKSLILDPSSTGSIRLNLELTTYFRT